MAICVVVLVWYGLWSGSGRSVWFGGLDLDIDSIRKVHRGFPHWFGNSETVMTVNSYLQSRPSGLMELCRMLFLLMKNDQCVMLLWKQNHKIPSVHLDTVIVINEMRLDNGHGPWTFLDMMHSLA